MELQFRVKVRNQSRFLDIIIPEHEDGMFSYSEIFEEKNRNFAERQELSKIEKSLMDRLDSLISDNGLPLDNTIVYRFINNSKIECMGIDDGYEKWYNR